MKTPEEKKAAKSAYNKMYRQRKMTEEQRKQQLATLNTERRTKIKATVGSSKDKKLEKERKAYFKKYGEDAQAKWIDEVEGYATNN